MSKKRLPKSLRKYIRKEKARIRVMNLGLDKEKELINQLYQRFLKQNENAGNFQSGDK